MPSLLLDHHVTEAAMRRTSTTSPRWSCRRGHAAPVTTETLAAAAPVVHAPAARHLATMRRLDNNPLSFDDLRYDRSRPVAAYDGWTADHGTLLDVPLFEAAYDAVLADLVAIGAALAEANEPHADAIRMALAPIAEQLAEQPKLIDHADRLAWAKADSYKLAARATGGDFELRDLDGWMGVVAAEQRIQNLMLAWRNEADAEATNKSGAEQRAEVA